MAFDSENISALSYANGFTLWHYRTNDAATLIDNTGYFDEAARLIRVGDFILLNCKIDSTPENGVVVVSANTGTSVNTTNITNFGAVDLD